MVGAVPVEALRGSAHGVLLSSADGRVCFCNAAAARLLGTASLVAEGRPCWTVGRLETLDGDPFCGPDCPIRRHGRAGRLGELDRVVLRTRPPDSTDVELITFLVEQPSRERLAALHILLPVLPAEAFWADSRNAAGPDDVELLPSRISAREMEVLHLLARGLKTAAIASTLRISPVTVRTHVQRILKKLGLHRRLEAVLALLGRSH